MVSWLLGLPFPLKVAGLLAFVEVQATTVDVGPVNSVLNVVAIGLIVAVGFRAGRSKLKDETIRDLRESNEAKDERLKELRDELEERLQGTRQIEAGVAHLREQLVAAEARYDEQGKYTAEHALAAVMTAMEKADEGHERRHLEVMAAFESLNTALGR